MKTYKEFLNEANKKYKIAYYKDVNGDKVKVSYENGRYYATNMNSVDTGKADAVYDELPKDLEFIGTPRTMKKESMNPYKKQTAIDYIYRYQDVSNDKEAEAYLKDMLDSGMDIDDVITYFERG